MSMKDEHSELLGTSANEVEATDPLQGRGSWHSCSIQPERDLSWAFGDDTEWWETDVMQRSRFQNESYCRSNDGGEQESTSTEKRIGNEQDPLIYSVKWLGYHVCRSVLNRLGSEVHERRRDLSVVASESTSLIGGCHSDTAMERVPSSYHIGLDESMIESDARRRSRTSNFTDDHAPTPPAMTQRRANRRSSLCAGWAPMQARNDRPEDMREHNFIRAMRRSSLSSLMLEETSQQNSERLSIIHRQQRRNSLGNSWISMQKQMAAWRSDHPRDIEDCIHVVCKSNGIPRNSSESSLASQMSELSISSKVLKIDEQTSTKQKFDVTVFDSSNAEKSLVEPVEQARTGDSLPYTSTHRSALLFVDISGFTALSQVLDPDRLSKTINAYFELIVNEVVAYNGDVLKFAGDALFAEWQAFGDDDECLQLSDGRLCGVPQTNQLRHGSSLADCVATAAMCGANIIAKLSDFPVNGTNGVQVAILNVHCGLGAGNVTGVHIGDSVSRREYLFIGDPIDQVSEASSQSIPGELMASPEALNLLRKRCRIGKGLSRSKRDGPVLLARKSMSRFMPMAAISFNHQTTHSWKDLDSDSLDEYRKLVSLYVHPVVLENDKYNFNNPRLAGRAEARHREEAELRSVYVMFISMPDVMAMPTGDESKDHVLFQTLNDIMKLTSRELDAFSGHFRQFIFDDKGLLLIATFGLRGSSFPNMIADRALPATCKIHEALHSELGIRSVIGATIGNAYCGVVGGIERHEYAVLGPSVNLAARLMASPFNPGILVDEAVRLKAGKCYRFNALTPIKAKGYLTPVPIFEPLNSFETRWKRERTTFVGRQSEINQLSSLAKDIVFFGSPAKLTLVSSPSGTGKSTFVAHAISHLQLVLRRNRKRVLVSKHVCKDGDQNTPLSMFRSVLVDVLTAPRSSSDDKSGAFTVRSLSARGSIVDSNWGSCSKVSIESNTEAGISNATNRLLAICGELGAPLDFVKLIGHHLLGMNFDLYEGEQPPSSSKTLRMQTTVELIVRIFQICTEHIDLVVIAIDEVHRLDEMSWIVLQNLFETGGNLLITCISLPVPEHKIKMPEEFWAQLNGTYSRQGRFVPISLRRFNADEMRSLVAKHIDCDENELCSTFLDDIFTQSGGMPHFANEILECVRRRNMTKLLANGCVGWEERLPFASVGELIIHRIDSYDANVRYVLSIGAVFGESFETNEIVAIFQDISDFAPLSQSNRSLVQEALDFLVAEGVLSDVCEGGMETSQASLGLIPEGSDQSHGDKVHDSEPTLLENRSYNFCHDIWRSTILSLMLDDRIRSIHQVIALTLAGQQQVSVDYLSRLRLFGHWKASGESSKAVELALSIGKSFEELGLSQNSVGLYEDALDLWRQPDGGDQHAASIPRNILKTIDVTAVENIILLYVAIGKCAGNLANPVLCVTAYQNALETLQESPAGERLKDRSIVFPIFSGIFLAIKLQQIQQDSECTYEQNLVANFVNETRLHGDPVHYLRALSMQAEMYGRMGKIDAAFEAHDMLEKVYDVERHSASVSKSYGSDRVGQSFGRSALWHMQKGNPDDAMRACRNVIYEMLPKMERRNVHNALMMIYPVIWIMKELGAALEARAAFHTYLVRPFEELWENGTTFGKPLYAPIMMILDLAANPDIGTHDREVYLEWALHEENLRLGEVLNAAWAPSGRYPDAITAEICLLLAKQVSEEDVRTRLIRNGFQVIRELDAAAKEANMTASFAYGQLESLHASFKLYAWLVQFEDSQEYHRDEIERCKIGNDAGTT